jgi:A/G-specific adenine glycosylase
MLQQTRVQAALPYYERFLRRFPDIRRLAAAPESAVLESWAGLGYYRRARNVWSAANKIVAERNGDFPNRIEDIRQLPGIGRYTAGAIRSIAFNYPEPVVDGNVRRVISRLCAAANAPESFYWSQAESWLERANPSEFNQAVMELGALVCLPAQPSCEVCPLRSLCCARAGGCVSGFPARSPKRVTEAIELAMVILECGRNIMVEQLPESGFIPGVWGLPHRLLAKGEHPLLAARTLARAVIGSAPQLVACSPVHHAIAHRRIVAHVFRAALESPPPSLAHEGRFVWRNREKANALLTSSLFRKAVAGSQ